MSPYLAGLPTDSPSRAVPLPSCGSTSEATVTRRSLLLYREDMSLIFLAIRSIRSLEEIPLRVLLVLEHRWREQLRRGRGVPLREHLRAGPYELHQVRHVPPVHRKPLQFRYDLRPKVRDAGNTPMTAAAPAKCSQQSIAVGTDRLRRAGMRSEHRSTPSRGSMRVTTRTSARRRCLHRSIHVSLQKEFHHGHPSSRITQMKKSKCSRRKAKVKE